VVEGFVRAGSLEKAVLAKIKPGGGGIFGLRKKITDFYIQNLPQPHSALIAGMVLGSKSDLQQSFWEKLKYTGLAHVVVASGTNVSLVASFLINSFTLFVKRKKAIFLTTLGIIFYVVLSGFDAPIVRAAIMAGLAFAAQLKGRLNQGLRTLFITAIVMLFISPSWVNDLGFLLSFVSTLCLIVFEPGLRRFLTWVPNLFREGFATSLAAQVGVAPILYFAFGRVNILSPLINALVLWTTPMIMVTGMVAGLIGIIIEPIGKLILYLGFPLTSWFVFVVDLFS
jgi:competence protein ComEC